MPNVFFDPFVFACPMPGSSSDDFRDYIDNIRLWNDLRNSSWKGLYVSGDTLAVLEMAGAFPLWDRIEATIQRLGIRDIQTKDVIDIIYGTLQKLPAIEDTLDVSEILLENGRFRPDYHIKDRPSAFVGAYERIVVLMHLFCHFNGSDQKNEFLATRYLCDTSVKTQVDIDLVDCEFRSRSYVRPIPSHVDANFTSCLNPDGVYRSAEPQEILVHSIFEDDFHSALDVEIYQTRLRLGPLNTDARPQSWSIGPRFLVTAKEHGFLNEITMTRMLLRACCETVLEQRLSDTHWLRAGRGANEPQVKRNVEGAWRRDIDAEYHLHYWDTPTGPEFACVVVHNEMGIPRERGGNVRYASSWK